MCTNLWLAQGRFDIPKMLMLPETRCGIIVRFACVIGGVSQQELAAWGNHAAAVIEPAARSRHSVASPSDLAVHRLLKEMT